MDKQVLRPDEAAAYLRVSKRSIYRLVAAGQLPAFKVGASLRIQKKAVREFIRRQIEDFEYETGYSDQA